MDVYDFIGIETSSTRLLSYTGLLGLVLGISLLNISDWIRALSIGIIVTIAAGIDYMISN